MRQRCSEITLMCLGEPWGACEFDPQAPGMKPLSAVPLGHPASHQEMLQVKKCVSPPSLSLSHALTGQVFKAVMGGHSASQ